MYFCNKNQFGNQGDLSKDDLDLPLLTLCVEHKRGEVAKHLISACGARAHVDLEVQQLFFFG